MSEEITFLPTFTGEAVWWKGKESAEVFYEAPVLRAISRHGYKQLKLSFGIEVDFFSSAFGNSFRVG
jgi:hypothetical protein